MREIKFRAWNKHDEIMEHINDLYWFEENGVHDFNDNNYEFMQYTRVKDVNGTEIYEGDIVNICTEGGCNPAKVIFDNEDQKGCFCVIGYLGDLRTYPIKDFVDCEIEVIGNIYENPELLHREEMEN